jgi:trigger factor
MNISKNQVDDLNIVLSLDIENADYIEQVSKVLREYRQKASFPGFRPGKVPEGLIRKMYGKAILVEKINDLISESIGKYVEDEKLQLLGGPLPVTDGDQLDWEIGNSFHFDVEMGLSPVIDTKLSQKYKLTKYKITIDKELITKNTGYYASSYGKFVETDVVEDFSEKLMGNIVQLNEDKTPVENGLSVEDTSLLLSVIKDEKLKKPFKKAKINDEIIFNLSETFPNDWEIASILKKKNIEEVGDITTSLFKFTVLKINKFVNAELNQELFDKVYGEGTVTSIEDFESRIENEMTENFENATLSKFGADAKEYLLQKINPPLPDQFLHKWLWNSNKEQMDESTFEQQFPDFIKEIQWSVISGAIVKDYDVKVEENEVIDYAKVLTKNQFLQYGITNFPEDELTNYAMNYLKEEKNVQQVISILLDKKIAQLVLDNVNVTVKEVTPDEYNKLIAPKSDKK